MANVYIYAGDSMLKFGGFNKMADVESRKMSAYETKNGRHFNERLLNYATAKMRAKDKETGKERSIVPYSKADVDDMLTRHGVKLDRKCGLDYVYVANMAKADFWRSSIEDERHLALYVKDVIDDCDAEETSVFDRWAASAGDDIPWEELVE